MDHHPKYLLCDQVRYPVFAARTQPNTIAGTVWRFVLSENKTLVVIPHQTKQAPAHEVHGIPDHIESVFGGLTYFKSAVLQVLAVPFTEPAENTQTHVSTNPAKAKRGALIRARVKTANAKRTAEPRAQATAELGRALHSYGIKYPGKEKLDELFDFIRKWVRGGRPQKPHLKDVDLREALAKVRLLTGAGVNLEERVFLDHAPEMPSLVDTVAQAAALEGIGIDEARRGILRGTRFVATFEKTRLVLVKDYSVQPHDKEDHEIYEQLAPSGQTNAASHKTGARSANASQPHSSRLGATSSKKETPSAGDQHLPTGPIGDQLIKRSCYRNKEGHERPVNDANLVSASKLAEVFGVKDRSRTHRDILDSDSMRLSSTYYLNGIEGPGRRPKYLISEEEWAAYEERKKRERANA